MTAFLVVGKQEPRQPTELTDNVLQFSWSTVIDALTEPWILPTVDSLPVIAVHPSHFPDGKWPVDWFVRDD